MDCSSKYFAPLRDPQVERAREHPLDEILLTATVASLSVATGWNEIEDDAQPGGTTTTCCICWEITMRLPWKTVRLR